MDRFSSGAIAGPHGYGGFFSKFMNSGTHRRKAYTENRSNFGCGHYLPVIFQLYRIAAIKALFFESRPFAIARLVMTIVVDSFYGHSWGTCTHVCRKVLETLPSIADANTTGTVPMKPAVGRQGAPRAHRGPGSIKRMFFSPPSFSPCPFAVNKRPTISPPSTIMGVAVPSRSLGRAAAFNRTCLLHGTYFSTLAVK